jgi:predicted metal-dependent HD superfamily phosphohydrolase
MGMWLTPGGDTTSENFFRLDRTGRQSLADAWQTLAGQHSATSTVIEQSLADLLRHYDARGRHYHNSSHLAALLRWYERYQNELRDPAVVQFAIWFHDVIYRTRRHDNEPRSADYATTTLARLKTPLAVIDDVASLIRATQTHRLDALPERLHHDGGWFLDFDLAILGSRPDVYAAYAQAIRREYFWVPAFLFRQKRRAVLEIFLQRPQLYFTESMRTELETQARANLTNELTELK